MRRQQDCTHPRKQRPFPGASPLQHSHTPRRPDHSTRGPRDSLCGAFAKMVLWLLECFVPEEKLKDAEREREIIKMGTGCSNRLGSTSLPNEAIIHFPIGPGRPWLIPQPATSAPLSGSSAGSPAFLWINHASGALTAGSPLLQHVLMIRTGKGH